MANDEKPWTLGENAPLYQGVFIDVDDIKFSADAPHYSTADAILLIDRYRQAKVRSMPIHRRALYWLLAPFRWLRRRL